MSQMIINSLALNKRISSSATIKHFISFIQSLKDKDMKVIFVVDCTNENLNLEKIDLINGSQLLTCVYWNINKNYEIETEIKMEATPDEYFISLTGNILQLKNEIELNLIGTILDPNSSNNLLSLFIDPEKLSSLPDDSSSNSTARNLLNSLACQARLHLDLNSNEGEPLKAKNFEIYFQSSVIIGNKQEYPVYIVKRDDEMVMDKVAELDREFIDKLTDSNVNYTIKSQAIHSFYSAHPQIDPEVLESQIFSIPKIYESLFEKSIDLDELEGIVKNLRGTGLKLSDLLEDPLPMDQGHKCKVIENQSSTNNDHETKTSIDIDFNDLNKCLLEIFDARTPHSKSLHLLNFHSSLTSQFTAKHALHVNADTLLPLLTYVLVQLERGYEILPEIRFLERYAHTTSISGIRGYVLTNIVNYYIFIFVYYFIIFIYTYTCIYIHIECCD